MQGGTEPDAVGAAEVATRLALGLDATSSTLLCCDAAGRPLTPALMYNDARAVSEAQLLARIAPADSAVAGASSSLAKQRAVKEEREVLL